MDKTVRRNRLLLFCMVMASQAFNTATIQAANANSSLKATCGKSLGDADHMTPTPGNTLTREKQIDGLKKAGFSQIDASAFFSRGSMVLEVGEEGALIPYKSVFPDLHDPHFHFVSLKFEKNERNEEELKVFLRNGSIVTSYALASYGRSEVRSEHLNLEDFTDEPHAKLLGDAHFTPDPNNPSLFRHTFDFPYAHQVRSVLIVLKNGRIEQIVERASPQLVDKLSSTKAAVVGFKLYSNKQRHGVSAVKLSEGWRTFELADDCSEVEGSQEALQDLETAADASVGLNLHEIPQLPDDIMIGGFNLSAWLRTTPILRGRRPPEPNLEDLKSRLKPGPFSDDGFIGMDENFEELQRADHEYVLSLGINHKVLSYPLLKILAAISNGLPHQFKYHGVRYRWSAQGFKGYQESPFYDGLEADADFTIKNLDTGAQISFSEMIPELIYRYGHYEGRENLYRLDPNDILKVFPFLATNPDTSDLQNDVEDSPFSSGPLNLRSLTQSQRTAFAQSLGLQLDLESMGSRPMAVNLHAERPGTEVSPHFTLIALSLSSDGRQAQIEFAGYPSFRGDVHFEPTTDGRQVQSILLSNVSCQDKRFADISKLQMDFEDSPPQAVIFDAELTSRGREISTSQIQNFSNFLNGTISGGLPRAANGGSGVVFHFYGPNVTRSEVWDVYGVSADENGIIQLNYETQDGVDGTMTAKLVQVISLRDHSEIILQLNDEGQTLVGFRILIRSF